MRPFSTTAAILVAGVLALLLIVYVFAGGGAAQADRSHHCTSAQALDEVKAELFRRAAAIRGTTGPGFTNVANYSAIHADSRLLRRHHAGSATVTCSGTLALDLPPGVAVVGGRRSLAGALTYNLAPAGDGTARLLTLSKADQIVIPLATLSNAGSQSAQPLQPAPPAAQPQPNSQPAPPPQAVPAPPPRPAPPPPQPHAAAPKQPPPAKTSPPPSRSAPAPAATAKPSFNCRNAHTSGEIAVCHNPALASLDRQMSSEYYHAVAAATPGQKAILERTRNRFLGYRDSCGSEACIADAYRGRMREIADIMAGRW